MEGVPTGTLPLAAFPGKHDVCLELAYSEYLTFPLLTLALVFSVFSCVVDVDGQKWTGKGLNQRDEVTRTHLVKTANAS